MGIKASTEAAGEERSDGSADGDDDDGRSRKGGVERSRIPGGCPRNRAVRNTVKSASSGETPHWWNLNLCVLLQTWSTERQCLVLSALRILHARTQATYDWIMRY